MQDTNADDIIRMYPDEWVTGMHKGKKKKRLRNPYEFGETLKKVTSKTTLLESSPNEYTIRTRVFCLKKKT